MEGFHVLIVCFWHITCLNQHTNTSARMCDIFTLQKLNSPSQGLTCNSLNTLKPTRYQYKQDFWKIIYSSISGMEEINNGCKESVTKHCECDHYDYGNLFMQSK